MAGREALRLSLDFGQDGDENLDSRGAPVMGRTMASRMKPPAVCASNSLPLAGGRAREILPLAGDASFRRYFRVVEGEPTARC